MKKIVRKLLRWLGFGTEIPGDRFHDGLSYLATTAFIECHRRNRPCSCVAGYCEALRGDDTELCVNRKSLCVLLSCTTCGYATWHEHYLVASGEIRVQCLRCAKLLKPKDGE